MNRSLSFSVLFSNWVVGFFLFFLFPPEINKQVELDKTTIQTVNGEISESFQTPESITLEIEWKLQFFIPSRTWNTFSETASQKSSFFSNYTTLPLFDVKKLFIHFFHTW